MEQAEAIRQSVAIYLQRFQFTPKVQEIINRIVSGIIELAVVDRNSNMDSISIGGTNPA